MTNFPNNSAFKAVVTGEAQLSQPVQSDLQEDDHASAEV
jgi:hypothetical protein